MQTITVKAGQSLFDAVLEATGDITNAYAMAKANNITITDSIEVGTVLIVAGVEKRSITSLYQMFAPATAANITEITQQPQGIDFMAVEIDFIVS